MSWIDTLLGRSRATPVPDPDGALLRCRDAVVRRGDFAVTIPDWTVMPGSVVGLVGPNGAGKSTLLEALVGLRAVTAGEARVAGLDPTPHGPQVRASVSLMSDDMPVFPGRVHTVLRKVSAYYPTWDDALATDLLARFQIDRNALTWRLSKGEGTRFRLVLALAWAPKLVLLDEPGTGLDLAQRRSLLETILEVATDADRAVVVSSHQLADVERIADELLVLSRGGVVRRGPIDTLVDDGQTLEEALLAWGAA